MADWEHAHLGASIVAGKSVQPRRLSAAVGLTAEIRHTGVEQFRRRRNGASPGEALAKASRDRLHHWIGDPISTHERPGGPASPAEEPCLDF